MIQKQIRAALVALTSALALVTTSTIAIAQPDTDNAAIDYAALGDSYAAGLGAGNVDPASGNCARFDGAYPVLVAQQLSAAGKLASFVNVACSGATTADVRATQLGVLNPGTDLVSLTVGGNDAGLVQFGGACITPGQPDCSDAPTQTALNQMPTVAYNVKMLLRDIAMKAPNAKIIVIGYGEIIDPVAVPSNPDPLCGQLLPQERIAGWAVENALDVALRVGVAQAGAKVVYRSPYKFPFAVRPVFAPHSQCDTGQPWYYGFNSPNSNFILHPTSEWHVAVANTLVKPQI